MLDKRFFLKEGPIIRDKYRDHTFKNARDINGKQFPPYNKSKASIKYGEDKRANKFKRQMTRFADSTAPVLTGDLLRDFTLVKVSDGGFQMGWTTFGARVKQLKDKGRVLTTTKKAIPDKIYWYLSDKAHKYIGQRLGKSKTKIHRIGKK